MGEPVKVPFGDWKLNVVYVKDVSNAFFLALYKDKLEYRLFQIGGEVTTPREIAEIVKKIIPDAAIEVEPGTLDIFHTLFDTSRAKEDLGWSPSYSLEEGIRDYIALIQSE